MSRKSIKPEEQKKFLTIINKHSVELGSIVNDLLDLSCIDSGKGLDLIKEKCNAGDTIRAIVGYTEKAYPKCRLVLALLGDPVDILADKARMTQVLKNLIGNAVKFSLADCTVKIAAKVVDGNYQVSIQDEGICMTSEETKKMFDRFYRADSSSTAKEGTGLGMSIVKYIVEAHDGKIWVESEAGRGTTVTFSIPIS